MTYFLLSFFVNVLQVPKFKLFALVYRFTHHRTLSFLPSTPLLRQNKKFPSFFPPREA